MSSASTQPAPDASVSVGMAPHTRRHHPRAVLAPTRTHTRTHTRMHPLPCPQQRSSPLPATAARSPAPVGGNALHVDHIGALRFRHYESLPVGHSHNQHHHIHNHKHQRHEGDSPLPSPAPSAASATGCLQPSAAAAAAANVLDSNALLLGETAEPGSRLPPPGTQRPPMALSARHWLSAHSVMSIDALMGSTDSNYDDTNAGCASAAQGSGCHGACRTAAHGLAVHSAACHAAVVHADTDGACDQRVAAGQPSSPTPSSSLFTLVEMAALCSELPTAHAHSPDSDDTVSSHSSNSVRSTPQHAHHPYHLSPSTPPRQDSPAAIASAVSGPSAASQSQTNEVRRFLCTICSKLFTRRYNLDAHIRSHMNVKPYACTHFVGGTNGKSPCTESFIRKHDLVRHIASVHERKMFGPCPWCGRSYSRSDSYNKHVRGEELLRGMAS
ncbi:hypothetical protein BC831DRAFT_458141 [Entophlyctis helioformis]|nr:hypothetical protein BC831DRAFT_458141 [Entophlyctis helioformis]